MKSVYGQTFIIQAAPKGVIDLDTLTVQSVLDSCAGRHYNYEITSLEFLKRSKMGDYDKYDIPVGDLKFVSLFLSKFCGVDKMNPIEVPLELQRYDVVKRNYSIVKGSELPDSGRYFVKDASNLKGFSYSGDLRYLINRDTSNKNRENPDYFVDSTLKIYDDNLYQLSEIVDFISEYRCFVNEGQIVGIQYYTGDPLVTLSESMINEMKAWVNTYSASKFSPRSYSLDVGIIEKDDKKQVALIEIHPITSLGLYGFCGNELPKMYKDGIDWYITVNRGVNECKIISE